MQGKILEVNKKALRPSRLQNGGGAGAGFPGDGSSRLQGPHPRSPPEKGGGETGSESVRGGSGDQDRSERSAATWRWRRSCGKAGWPSSAALTGLEGRKSRERELIRKEKRELMATMASGIWGSLASVARGDSASPGPNSRSEGSEGRVLRDAWEVMRKPRHRLEGLTRHPRQPLQGRLRARAG